MAPAPTHSRIGDGEAEVGPEDGHEEQQFHGQDRLDDRKPSDVQREGLQQERADHEAETQQPHAAADGVGHQAEAHGGLLRGVFDAHALEHAGQRVREGRSYGKDIDHRLATNLVVRFTDHAGSSQLVLRFCLDASICLSRARIMCKRPLRTGSGPSPPCFCRISLGVDRKQCGNCVTFTSIFRH